MIPENARARALHTSLKNMDTFSLWTHTFGWTASGTVATGLWCVLPKCTISRAECKSFVSRRDEGAHSVTVGSVLWIFRVLHTISWLTQSIFVTCVCEFVCGWQQLVVNIHRFGQDVGIYSCRVCRKAAGRLFGAWSLSASAYEQKHELPVEIRFLRGLYQFCPQ